MNILFVSEYFPPKIMGGGEINLSLLVKSLSKKGVNVSVLTSYHKGLKRFEEAEGIKIYRRLKTGANPEGILSNLKRSVVFPGSIKKEVTKLLNREKEKNFDIIHFIGTSIIATKEFRRLRKPKLFTTIESYPSLCPKGNRFYHGKKECKYICSFSKFIRCQKKSSEIGKIKNNWYLKRNMSFLIYLYSYYKKLNNSLKYCNLIAISKYVQGILSQYGLRSKVIPNLIDINAFQIKEKEANNKEKKKKKKPTILYLGSLTKFKGPQVLIQAIKELKKEGINCKCHLYGKGNIKETLQKIISDYNLDAEIHSPVPYDKIPSIYANSDIVIFPSIWPEPFGRISIEAMAAGKPVIGSNIGGIKETITKDAGILVAPGDVLELKEAIKKMLKCELKQANVKHYSEYIVVDRLIKEYKG